MTKYARAYLPTIRTTVEVLADGLAQTLRPGQWIQIDGTGPRGQFLGLTRQGVFVIRWQKAPRWTGTREELTATHDLRGYAIRYGSK